MRRCKVEVRTGNDFDLRLVVATASKAAKTGDIVLAALRPAVRVDELGGGVTTCWRFPSGPTAAVPTKKTTSAVRGAIVASFKDTGSGLPKPDVRLS